MVLILCRLDAIYSGAVPIVCVCVKTSQVVFVGPN